MRSRSPNGSVGAVVRARYPAVAQPLEDTSYGRHRITVRKRDDHPHRVQQKSRRDRVVDLLEHRVLPAVNDYMMRERPADAECPRCSSSAAVGSVRLLAGEPLHTNGALTKEYLAREPQNSHATVHRAEDILAEWNPTVDRLALRSPGRASGMRRSPTPPTASRVQGTMYPEGPFS
ncbi:hypothetical protein [Streptomyces sp.]|uniref:hypothetical protein n=1 Tax=Streptomyces sp. TaxID=1931 RepID=UPI002D792006|nr:hypothetical protein [Streptomyces sp.]HET6357935.1 hypothetical protein [Streptomyces sp.]